MVEIGEKLRMREEKREAMGEEKGTETKERRRRRECTFLIHPLSVYRK